MPDLPDRDLGPAGRRAARVLARATTSPPRSRPPPRGSADGDVVVVTSKVVSKVEGRLVRVPPGADREAARQRAIDDETVRVVARRGR